MSTEQSSDSNTLKLSFSQKAGILLSFAKDKIIEQIQCVWFIILYLIVFQVLVLGLPIVYSLMIAAGIMIVIIGLAFFMEGLRLGLMPLGETLGSTLPRKKILGIPCLPTSLAFGFVLGAFATFAEPAIGVLRAAGAGVDPTAAPLLWTILNTGAGLLVQLFRAKRFLAFPVCPQVWHLALFWEHSLLLQNQQSVCLEQLVLGLIQRLPLYYGRF